MPAFSGPEQNSGRPFSLKMHFSMGTWRWTETYYWCESQTGGRSALVAQMASFRRAILSFRATLTSITVAPVILPGGFAKDIGPVIYQGVEFNMGLGLAAPATIVDGVNVFSGPQDPWTDAYFNLYSDRGLYRRGNWLRAVPSIWLNFVASRGSNNLPAVVGTGLVRNWIYYLCNTQPRTIAVAGDSSQSGTGTASTTGTTAADAPPAAGVPDQGSFPLAPRPVVRPNVPYLTTGKFVIRGQSKDPAVTKPQKILAAGPATDGCSTVFTLDTPGLFAIGSKVHINGVTGCFKKGLNGYFKVLATSGMTSPFTVTVATRACCCGTYTILPTGTMSRVVYAWYSTTLWAQGRSPAPSFVSKRATGSSDSKPSKGRASKRCRT